jgi:triacylglycerol lipase
MPKPLPPATIAVLNPPASAAFPYVFFENAAAHPFRPDDAHFSLVNAWWLMDAAFLAYSAPADIERNFGRVSASARLFSGALSTQCCVAETPGWILLALRGTQVDDFWASVVDWSVDARFVPAPDLHGDWVHVGFRDAIAEVWGDVAAHLRGLQAARPRPFWITGHSLGAALATLAANLCSDEPGQFGLKGLYTFGSPRVGDSGFGRRIGCPVWRFKNNSDLVTNVPLGLVFRHVGTTAFIDGGGHYREIEAADGGLLESIGPQLSVASAHTLGTLIAGATANSSMPGFLADHAPVNYAIRIWNCYEAAIPPAGAGL